MISHAQINVYDDFEAPGLSRIWRTTRMVSNSVDHFYDKLLEGGKEQQCGWLTDKYGVTLQIVPKALPDMLSDKDREKAQRVTNAMLKMKKLIIEYLKRAYEQ
jgi:predicted 3-demethylubiquinone-9 3-methyltransferase (glyoxalase superfamily)